MKQYSKVIFVLLGVVVSILFSQTVFAETENPDMPEYCLLLLDSDEPLSSTTVAVNGISQIEPKTSEEIQEYHIMLPRADNGRGNGTIHYSNPLLPMGEEHEYALVQYWNIDGENQPYEGSNIYPSVIGEDGELIFSISELGYGCNLFICKVLTLEEVVECNQFLENKIELENFYSVDGFVFIPLKDYGIMDRFALRIQASNDSSENYGDNNSSVENDEEQESNNSDDGHVNNSSDEPIVIEDDDCDSGGNCDVIIDDCTEGIDCD
jgi:hypothetical protein